MPQFTQPSLQSQIQKMRTSFLQQPEFPFGDLLPKSWFEQLDLDAGNYRTTVFSPLVTLEAFIKQTLSADGSCKEAVAGVWASRVEQQLPPPSVNTGPYCKARQRLPEELLHEAVQLSGEGLHAQAPEAWQWQGYNVKVVDGTTLLMADTPANQAQYPQPRSQQNGLGFPIARLVGVLSLSSGAVVDYALGPYRGKRTGELSLFARQLDSLTVGDLLLGDSYYCTYGLIALLEQREIPVVFELHAQRKADFRRGKRLGSKDHLVQWKKPVAKPVWMSADDYRALPATLTVRELAVGDKVYLTTLLDTKRFSKRAIATLYALRWTVELDLRTLKTELKMEKLRCQTSAMVRKEIAVHFLAYNFVRAAMAHAAQRHRQLPRALSFKATVQLIDAIKTQLLDLSHSALEALLKAIASTPIGQRQRAPQPRAVKQRPKPYPRLAVPRKIACQQLVASYSLG